MVAKTNVYLNEKGFTLVELLISISLIAILSGVLFSVINARGIQSKARDAQRVSDLAKIKIALESYFSDNRGYPVSASWAAVSTLTVLSPSYINVIPSDPKAAGTVCGGSNWRGYAYKSDGSKYILTTNMELASSAQATCPTGYNCIGCAFPGGYGYFTIAD